MWYYKTNKHLYIVIPVWNGSATYATATIQAGAIAARLNRGFR